MGQVLALPALSVWPQIYHLTPMRPHCFSYVSKTIVISKISSSSALADVAQVAEHFPVHQRVTGLIPSVRA